MPDARRKNYYSAVKDRLFSDLVRPLLKEGGILPSKKDLAKRYNVNVGTLDKALQELNTRYGKRHEMTMAQTAAFVAERDAILQRYPGFERSYEQFAAHLLHALRVLGPDHVGIGLDWDGGGGVSG